MTINKKTIQKQKFMEAIAANDIRRLNWWAMKYFIYHDRLAEAAACRDRVVAWNRKGPV